MTRNLSPLSKTAIVTGIAALIGLAFAFAEVLFLFNGPLPEIRVFLIRAKLFVATFNLVLLVVLTGTYISLYRDIPNKYSRSLVVLSLALLLYAVTANPFTHLLFGFRPVLGVGPFTYLSDIFVGFAIIILFYQSQT